MVTATMKWPTKDLRTAEEEAWAEYLETTRLQTSVSYEEVEPWAWNRLCKQLHDIHRKREANT